MVIDRLVPAGVFTYRAADAPSSLVEHELDHVFVAIADTSSTAACAMEVSELVRLPFFAVLELVMSDSGALSLRGRRRSCGDLSPLSMTFGEAGRDLARRTPRTGREPGVAGGTGLRRGRSVPPSPTRSPLCRDSNIIRKPHPGRG